MISGYEAGGRCVWFEMRDEQAARRICFNSEAMMLVFETIFAGSP